MARARAFRENKAGKAKVGEGRRGWALVVSILAVLLWGCSGGKQSAAPGPRKWSIGFWFWEGSSVAVRAATPVDAIYAQAGSIERNPSSDTKWGVYCRAPRELPPAGEYWLVVRLAKPGVPGKDALPQLASRLREALAAARTRGLPVAGVQLDIDCPTRLLADYAAWLGELRRQLPPGAQLSITALLDWFRDGAAIDQVIARVDEFAPQFYDTQQPRERSVVAAPIDARRWGPVFERFGKSYRIGVSSFGRATFVRAGRRQNVGGSIVFPDVTPLEVGQSPAFRLAVSRTPAQETLLHFDATDSTSIGWSSFAPGDQIEFVIPTMESMRSAVSAARSMGVNCAGVVFFRWPADRETMAAQPDQALRAAGARGVEPPRLSLHAVDGGCAAVRCTDLYITDVAPLSPSPLRRRIRSSMELEYFVPADDTPVRLVAPDLLELRLPPFVGASRMYLGRAVTAEPAGFQMEEVQP
jgi:hypothetical protein